MSGHGEGREGQNRPSGGSLLHRLQLHRAIGCGFVTLSVAFLGVQAVRNRLVSRFFLSLDLATACP